MIRVLTLYPSKEGSKFDFDYYMNIHMKLVRERLGNSLVKDEVDQGLGTIEPGEFIGEGAFINNRERSTSARAKTDTIVLAITPEALTQLPNVIRKKIKDRIIEGMSERITKLSDYIENHG